MAAPQQVKDALRRGRADLAGIASPHRLLDLAPECNWLSISLHARAVFVLGRRTRRGLLRATEKGTKLGTGQKVSYS